MVKNMSVDNIEEMFGNDCTVFYTIVHYHISCCDFNGIRLSCSRGDLSSFQVSIVVLFVPLQIW